MATVRGWPFLTVAWCGLGQALFAFALIYLLALGDHHLTERIPTHEHLVPMAQSVPDHSHGFAQRHAHNLAAAAWSAPAYPAVAPARTAMMTALLWLNDLVPPDAAPPSASLLWVPLVFAALILTHQLVMRPATPPPLGTPLAH